PVNQHRPPAKAAFFELGDAQRAERAQRECQLEAPRAERTPDLPAHDVHEERAAILVRDLREVELGKAFLPTVDVARERVIELPGRGAPTHPPRTFDPPPPAGRARVRESGVQASSARSHTRIGMTITWMPANCSRRWIEKAVSWCSVRVSRFSRWNTSWPA